MVATESLRRELAARGINNLCLWSRGIDTAHFHPREKADKPFGLHPLQRRAHHRPADIKMPCQTEFCRQLVARREASQPVKARTGGSTFRNPAGRSTVDGSHMPLAAWRLIDEAGILPPGVLNVITGSGSKSGSYLLKADVDKSGASHDH